MSTSDCWRPWRPNFCWWPGTVMKVMKVPYKGHQSISRNWLMFMKNGLIQSGAPKRNCVQLVQKTSITMVYGTYNYNYIILFIKQLITWEAPHCKDSQYWWMTMKMKCIPITTHQKIPVYPIVLPWYSRFISVKVGLFTILDI